VIIVHYGEDDCPGAYTDYIAQYGPNISFICEDLDVEGYTHFNP
jgi:hypothetical protein